MSTALASFREAFSSDSSAESDEEENLLTS